MATCVIFISLILTGRVSYNLPYAVRIAS